MSDIASQQQIELDLLNRYKGALLGLAVGDALGTTLEFTTPGTFKPLSDLMGGNTRLCQMVFFNVLHRICKDRRSEQFYLL